MKTIYTIAILLMMCTAASAAYIPSAVPTRTGYDTSAGGLATDTIDLGDTYDYIYITVNDSCVVGFNGLTLTLNNGDLVDRMFVFYMRARFIYVKSEVAYAYPKGIRVRGVR